jgi:membrane protease YdiL (CAAX protease family)
MTTTALPTAASGRRPAAITTGALVAGFVVAVAMRVVAGGTDVAHSAGAGLVFAAVLLVLTIASGARFAASPRAAAIGIAGSAVMLVPVGVARLFAGEAHRPAGGFVGWALVVAVVAVAEELFLRGALFDSMMAWRRSPVLAATVGAVCFAALHVPLYGWAAAPLDLAVGFWLATLRVVAGTVAAPAIAHTVADLAAWWLL